MIISWSYVGKMCSSYPLSPHEWILSFSFSSPVRTIGDSLNLRVPTDVSSSSFFLFQSSLTLIPTASPPHHRLLKSSSGTYLHSLQPSSSLTICHFRFPTDRPWICLLIYYRRAPAAAPWRSPKSRNPPPSLPSTATATRRMTRRRRIPQARRPKRGLFLRCLRSCPCFPSSKFFLP